MFDQLNVGVIGGGFMGRVHSRAARAAGGRLLAVATSSRASAERAAREFGADEPADVAGLIADDRIDVVHVCTPNALHAEQTIAALEAGKHVICEKPLATTPEEAERMVRALRAAGTTGSVPFVYRYHPMVREARERIRARGSAILSIDSAYLQDWMLSDDDDNWRTGKTGGGSRAFADVGSHLFDQIEFVTGERVVRLNAMTRTVFAERGGAATSNEDIAAVLFELSGGALGTALVSQMAAGRKNSVTLEVHTGEAAYRFEQERPEELWVGYRDGALLVPRDEHILSPDAARLCRVPAGHPQGYQDAFNGFVADAYAAVSGDTPEGLANFDDGLRSAQIVAAVIASASSGRWVSPAAAA